MTNNQTVRFPEMRAEVMIAVAMLSDLRAQHREWLAARPAEGFDDVVHALYDDTSLFDSPSTQVGICLKDATEAELIQRLFDALESVFEAIGTKASDAEYINHPLWINVVAAARDAHSFMSQNEQ